ncbi:thioesterase [Chryseobacterium sp. Leaf404]|uniref:acyl-CoA thioesterase n=1 Tax=unclassified Chryseobacterium TaxID=2593645 RepID=UPI0006F870D5|nr:MULTISPECIES: acyl-CoA thioesterase [unclassified Chryseobacterium]KQT16349.1 thioesterase [Chryseobacterium sp. Leaf404]
MSLIFEKQIKVSEEYIDANNHVNNVQYVKWVEEIASEHWDTVKEKLGFPHDIWMLLDHHIQYRKQVYLGNYLTIKTYPKPPEGIRQPRKVEFYCNDVLVAESLTLWVFIDHETQKIKKLDENWLSHL